MLWNSLQHLSPGSAAKTSRHCNRLRPIVQGLNLIPRRLATVVFCDTLKVSALVCLLACVGGVGVGVRARVRFCVCVCVRVRVCVGIVLELKTRKL